MWRTTLFGTSEAAFSCQLHRPFVRPLMHNRPVFQSLRNYLRRSTALGELVQAVGYKRKEDKLLRQTAK